MKTELIIKLNSEDCKKISKDLKKFIGVTNSLNPETYLLYNKIRLFDCAYSDIEKN